MLVVLVSGDVVGCVLRLFVVWLLVFVLLLAIIGFLFVFMCAQPQRKFCKKYNIKNSQNIIIIMELAKPDMKAEG